jgi:hypothetical protein
MTEDEFLKAWGGQPGSKSDGSTGKFVLGIARLFVGLPLAPGSDDYDKQQQIVTALREAEAKFGYDIDRYPAHLRILLLKILHCVNDITDDAMHFIVASLIFNR